MWLIKVYYLSLLKYPLHTHPSQWIVNPKTRKRLFDIQIRSKQSFHHVKLDQSGYILGLHHDKYFIDTCPPFGYRIGSALYQLLIDTVCQGMGRRHYDIINYIYAMVRIDIQSKIHQLFTTLQKLI